MMLAHVETMEAQPVVKLGEREPVFILDCERKTGSVVLIEYAEFHGKHPFQWYC